MQRKRDGLSPIGEVVSGPVKAIRDASPQARHYFTQEIGSIQAQVR